MLEYDTQYKDLLKRIVSEGVDTKDRTGTGTRKVFDANMNVNLTPAEDYGRLPIPALTLRKVFPRTAFYELVWMLSGSTDANLLKNKNISIWNGNTSREFLDSRGLHHLREGHGGKMYGHQFRNFNGVDQVQNVIDSLIKDPHSRRHFISLWNPAELDEMALPPCHVSYQFCVIGDTLNLKFYQRSADVILGVPTNILFASFFLHAMAQMTNLKAGHVAHSIADAHIYSNHLDVACDLIERPMIDHTASIEHDFFNSISCDLHRETLMELLTRTTDYFNHSRLDYISHDAIPREKLVMAV